MLKVLGRALLRSAVGPSRATAALLLPPRHQWARSVHVSSEEELSFAIITPKSLAKGHVGGIVARLLSTAGIRIVGARMYAPSAALRDELVKATVDSMQEDGIAEEYEESIVQFVEDNLTEEACSRMGIHNRFLLLLFAGQGTRKKLARIVGDDFPPPEEYGRTIRGTYGEYTRLLTGEALNFEPSVLIPHSDKSNRKKLEILAKYAESDGGVMKQKIFTYKGHAVETGLVMIKPDNFKRASALPGHILDLFGTTGLHMVGTKVFSMSMGQAKEFYGFLEEVFARKLRPRVEETLRRRLEGAFEFQIDDAQFSQMTDVLNGQNAKHELSLLLSYMTGIEAGLQNYAERKFLNTPGIATCFAVLYRGPKAIEIIRAKLGSTDPNKAEAGTIRSDYGHDLMRNGAHASDTAESVERERKVIGLAGDEPSVEKVLIENWLEATRSKHK